MFAVLIPAVGIIAFLVLQYGKSDTNKRFIWPFRKGDYNRHWNDGASHFGYRTSPVDGKRRFHAGLDIGADQGTPVQSIGDGTVSRTVENHSSAGTYIEIEHTGFPPVHSRYLHLSKPYVKGGDKVVKGQTIALSGGKPGTYGAGSSFEPHLHFETWDADPGRNWSKRTNHWFDPLEILEEP